MFPRTRMPSVAIQKLRTSTPDHAGCLGDPRSERMGQVVLISYAIDPPIRLHGEFDDMPRELWNAVQSMKRTVGTSTGAL
jgi:hypothetical protein